ncbi:MAG: SRPBCC family protein [Opitutaceae bacterium]|nr:SRPBCC family protein [Opitutaceae bacterium]
MSTSSTSPLPATGMIDVPVAAPARVADDSITGISVPGNRGVKVTRACTILRPPSDLYAFWRNIENLTLIIRHPAKIRRISEIESHWTVSSPPGDSHVEWVSLIINDHPNQLIAWRSREDAEIPNAGTVRFERAPGDEGSEVTVTLEYDPPGGKFGAWLAKLSGEEPGQQVSDTLRRFKALMETGEIPTIEGQSVGEPQLSRRAKK